MSLGDSGLRVEATAPGSPLGLNAPFSMTASLCAESSSLRPAGPPWVQSASTAGSDTR